MKIVPTPNLELVSTGIPSHKNVLSTSLSDNLEEIKFLHKFPTSTKQIAPKPKKKREGVKKKSLGFGLSKTIMGAIEMRILSQNCEKNDRAKLFSQATHNVFPR